VSEPVLIAGEPDPYPRLARLREAGPFAYDPHDDVYFVVSYPAAMAFLRTAQVSRQAYVEKLICQYGRNAILEAQKQELAFQDPPHHTTVKRLVMQVFTPAHLKVYRPRLQEIVTRSLAALPLEQPFDLLANWAEPVPSQVLAELMGVPHQRRSTLYEATRAIVAARGLTRTPEQLAAGNQAVRQLAELFEELCAQRRLQPQEDLITALLEAEDDGTRLDHASLLSVLSSLYAAGFGNVRNLIGNGLVALLARPDLVDLVRAQPQKWPAAIEEMLRFDAPTQATNPTQLLSDFVWEGHTLPAGARVAVYLAACNRDGAHFAQADDFRLERHPNDHLSFSSFTHFCPGAPLVRMQAELLLGGLLERYQVRVKGPLTWQRMNRFRGLEHLTVSLERV